MNTILIFFGGFLVTLGLMLSQPQPEAPTKPSVAIVKTYSGKDWKQTEISVDPDAPRFVEALDPQFKMIGVYDTYNKILLTEEQMIDSPKKK